MGFLEGFWVFFGGLFVSIRVLLSVSITGDDKHLSTFFFFPFLHCRNPPALPFPSIESRGITGYQEERAAVSLGCAEHS